MKQVKIFLIAFLTFLLLSVSVKAQTSFTTFSADVTHLHAIFPSTLIDSTDTVYSDWFTLAGYDYEGDYITQTDTANGLATVFVRAPLYATYKLTSSAGKPRILAIIQGTNNTGDATAYFTVDSLSANADSTESYQYTTMNFNAKRFFKYRLKITGTAGNRSDTYFQAELYLPRKKF